ncbi:MAG: acyl-CoA dehydrogenase [Gaiellales bacterium]|nr:acyl-CoA dehydrogenase [Gaiellales bacterium]
MDFGLTPELLDLKAQYREWVHGTLDPLCEPMEEEERLPDALVEELRHGKLRFFGLTIPKEYGGEGWAAGKWLPVLEEIARGYAMCRMIAHTMNGLFWRPLYDHGTEEQRRKYLPKLATGEIWAANALTEPEGGTGRDINATTTKDGEYYILSGHKWLITQFPEYTKLFYCFAATEEGMTCFLVDAPDEGLVLEPMKRMMGCRGPRHYNVYYRDLRVHESQILGEKGRGLDIALGMLHLSRVSIAYCGVGTAQRMLDLAVAYAKKRMTFGKLLSTRQAIQSNVAQMATEIEATRLLAAKAAWKFDQGLDMVVDASMAKMFSEQMTMRVAEMALRMHGGVGFTEAYPLERHFRDCRSFHFEEGTEEIQKLLIARSLLK